ncbi:Nucleoside-diphosphate-sugar epimerase [Natronoarchaeum philippinense]|uniref:Nucleoside-diphosphate-sugar epimerase n=1 Tax=Natronoarchaeum philippinense TaxID=558529 RepID=A0A285NUQ8_NATPI|nr:NAD-dependent epimerase/dehydratase family protein [Natronoarchaeum philippinense]SNZ12653.1 Nucleoside-diphosphate-sugar epimerase [Natronoarchaeum philippinense]
MRVLLIGGTGLISTGITRQLVEAGHEAVCMTRGEADADVPEAVEFVHGDRNDGERLDAVARETDADCVIDMVCFDAEQARAAVDAFADRVDQYVFCSTVDVYHRPPERNPVVESAAREPGVSEYGRNKAAAEDVFLDAHGDAFETTVLRPWSTYGEGGDVLHTLGVGSYYIDRIRRGKPIVVHGDGTSLWGPCHRDDVAAAFVGAVGNEAAYGETYHVTSEEVITWNQYHRRVARALDAPEPELVHIPTDQLRAALPERTHLLENHFQYSTVFDNAKARRDLGFEYTISFEDGVRRTVAALDERDAVDPWDSENDDAVVEAWRESAGSFVAQFE